MRYWIRESCIGCRTLAVWRVWHQVCNRRAYRDVMSFAMLPPEINSGLMYVGPGSGSMTEAATAWGKLATRLHTAAVEAAAPYIDWLTATAACAERAAIQAAAAASAHQTALAATIPPRVIDANRARRRSLAFRNCLGQNSPAIADADAEYERMWAQDADAMRAYAGASANAAAMTPFSSPPADRAAAARTWVLKSAPDVVSAGSHVMSTIPHALRALSQSPMASFDVSLSSATASLSKLSSLCAPSGVAITHLNVLNKQAALCSLFTKPGSAALIAHLGRGALIGKLSVPPAWATAATASGVLVRAG